MKTLCLAVIASLAAACLILIACTKGGDFAPASDLSQPGASAADQEQVVELSVTSEGFVPASFRARVGLPLRLVVTRKVERNLRDRYRH